MRWWKLLGLAGFVGVAATGVMVARAERHRRAYTPEEIRERLHTRLAEASGTEPTSPDGGPGSGSQPEPGGRDAPSAGT